MPKSSLSVKINKIREDRESISDDNVAVEEPLEIQICSNTSDLTAAKSVSITMRGRSIHLSCNASESNIQAIYTNTRFQFVKRLYNRILTN